MISTGNVSKSTIFGLSFLGLLLLCVAVGIGSSGSTPSGECFDCSRAQCTGVDLASSSNPLLENIFHLDNAWYRVQQIEQALDSFRLLTQKSFGVLSAKDLLEVGHTSWEFQYLAFPNWVNAVFGTLLKQQYDIAALQLEVANLKLMIGEVDAAYVKAKAEAYQSARAQLQAFIADFSIKD